MRQQKWTPLPEVGAPCMRRVLEAMRRLDNELACWDEQPPETMKTAGKPDVPQDQPLQ